MLRYMMHCKISPCLWFDKNQAEEAANFYVSIFDNARVVRISRYDAISAAAAGQAEGSVMLVEFELNGQPFQALNGNPQFAFTEAMSLSVECATQAEVDHVWGRLTQGGEEGPCGWLRDKFGVPWQVAPRLLSELLNDPDRERAQRVMETMLGMNKIDAGELLAAYEGSNQVARTGAR